MALLGNLAGARRRSVRARELLAHFGLAARATSSRRIVPCLTGWCDRAGAGLRLRCRTARGILPGLARNAPAARGSAPQELTRACVPRSMHSTPIIWHGAAQATSVTWPRQVSLSGKDISRGPMIGAVRLRSLSGGSCVADRVRHGLGAGAVRLQRAERLCAAAAAQGRCRAAGEAGRDALPERHRQHRRGQRHDAGGAGAGLHPGNRLQGRRRGQGRNDAVRHRAGALPAGARAGAGRAGGGRRLRQAVAGRLRAPAGAGDQEVSPRKQDLDQASRPARCRRRQAEADARPTSSRPSSTSATPRSRRRSTASSRRARCRWASWSAPAADDARHHRPARPDLCQLQRQRAGRAAGSRQHGQARADARRI